MVVYTSKIARQGEMLKSYFDAQTTRFPDWKCVEGKLTADNGNVCRWFATDSPGAVESFHADYLIRVLDEVKSMDDAIVDATNRWHPKMSVYVSSKGLMSGRFFECFTKNRERWSCHEWSAKDCPWMSESFLEQVREECGANSPTFKSMVSNEWSDVGVRNLITLEAVERCRKNAVGWIGGEIVAGIDPSAARKEGDEFVIYYRDGNRIYEPIIIHDCSTPLEAVAAAIRECKRINAKIINMDKGGIGLIMYNMFEEQLKGDQSIRLNGINFGGATLTKSEAYSNRAMEMAAALSRQIELHQLILPQDPKTISQLVTRQWTPTESGKMKLLSKELMRREGFRSPDRFDALMLCAQGEIPTQASLTGWRSNPFADPNFLAEEDDKHSQINHSYEGIDFGR